MKRRENHNKMKVSNVSVVDTSALFDAQMKCEDLMSDSEKSLSTLFSMSEATDNLSENSRVR